MVSKFEFYCFKANKSLRVAFVCSLLVFFIFLTFTYNVYAGMPNLGFCCIDGSFPDCFTCGEFDCATSQSFCENVLGSENFNPGRVCFNTGEGQGECRLPGPNTTGCCIVNSENSICVNNVIRQTCFGEGGNEAEFWVLNQECSNLPECTPQFINQSPPTATNFVGADHTVTATVDINGVPEADVLVNFEVISGPNAGEMSDPGNGECSVNGDCTTGGNGQVSWTYSSLIPGTDIIVASIGDTDIESNIVEKIWVLPPTNVPTLSEWGLIAMAGILGIVGFMVMRRRKVTA